MRINLKKETFGNLTVIREYGIDQNRRVVWLCQCSCGLKHKTTTQQLRSGKTTSCGCKAGNYNTTGEYSFNRARERWRKSVIARDGKCLKCGTKTNLQAHHLLSVKVFPELVFSLDNGVTVCKADHVLFHYYYGRRHFTPENFLSFVKETRE